MPKTLPKHFKNAAEQTNIRWPHLLDMSAEDVAQNIFIPERKKIAEEIRKGTSFLFPQNALLSPQHKAEYEKSGFQFGQPVSKNFVEAELPQGWRVVNNGHYHLADDQNRIRGQLAYGESDAEYWPFGRLKVEWKRQVTILTGPDYPTLSRLTIIDGDHEIASIGSILECGEPGRCSEQEMENWTAFMAKAPENRPHYHQRILNKDIEQLLKKHFSIATEWNEEAYIANRFDSWNTPDAEWNAKVVALYADLDALLTEYKDKVGMNIPADMQSYTHNNAPDFNI